MFRLLLSRLLGLSKYSVLNRVELKARNLKNNLQFITAIDQSISLAPVLKSNGYGHGLTQIARLIDSMRYPYLCVDSIYEAYQLIKAKIKTPILIMGYIDPSNLKTRKLPFSYAVFDLEFAKALDKYQKGSKIHLFVDTGLNREGVSLSELPEFISELRKLENIEIEGVMSHLATSNKNDPYVKFQHKNFLKAIKIFESLGIFPRWRHLCASGGLINGFYKGTNLSRVGRAIYGLDPNQETNLALKPVLKLFSKIIQIKHIKKGGKVGYDSTFEAKKDLTIGVLPIGYNDGVDRRLSNIGVVKVKGVFCPIVGRISMNITTIDISAVDNPTLGMEVEIISDNPEDKNSIESQAKLCKTIPHELLVHLPGYTRREVVN